MSLKRYKGPAAEILGIPPSTPMSEMLDIVLARYNVEFEIPICRLDKAKLLRAIARRAEARPLPLRQPEKGCDSRAD